MRASLLALALAFTATPAFAAAAPDVQRVETGNRISENIPEIPETLSERLAQYQNTRGAAAAGWLADGSLLITTRFGETNQAHRLRMAGGAREQLTFFKEPVNSLRPAPVGGANGFVFGKDVGGSEFWQLFYFDLDTRTARMLTDGRSRNQGPVWSRQGDRIAYATTRRNGRDTDVHIVDLDGRSVPVVEREGTWFVVGWSPDDRRLLVSQYLSINESRPYLVDIASGAMTPLYDRRRPAAYFGLAFAADGQGLYYVSDETGEFRELRHRDLATGRTRSLSAHIPWDVTQFVLSDDGAYLAFVSNEDGIDKVHLLDLRSGGEIALPELPIGLVGLGGFSADGRRLALTINSATSPSDVYVVDLGEARLTRWTESEVGGLDASRFVAPTLIRYPTFDEVDGKPRTIPAFYYRPAGEGPFPVVINIHGGPEAQARPGFNPIAQFLVNELKVAVLVPNVRGSSGYGKTYLQLDDGYRREDAIKDIGALLDWIAQQPELDADRVGVQGGSYGGYMVLASMVHYNQRLRAGIDVVGISNFVTFLENTESYRRDLRRAEYGDERDPKMRAFLEKISPLNNADRISRPLFVAQGANDPRVPASEAEQIVRAVRGNGGDVWYLLFKDEGHGFAKKSNADYYNAAAMLFWQTYLIGD